MSKRDTILAALRSHTLPPFELPAVEGSWITFPDPVEQFSRVLESVGGQARRVPNFEAANDAIDDLVRSLSAERVCSAAAGIRAANIPQESFSRPHDVRDVDLAIIPGVFGVAENAAIWITDEPLRFRVLPFLVQHLAIVLASNSIVNNMHEAYARLEGAFQEKRFGAFLSGPSKTADIEQSLVVGAHGARSLTVLLVDP